MGLRVFGEHFADGDILEFGKFAIAIKMPSLYFAARVSQANRGHPSGQLRVSQKSLIVWAILSMTASAHFDIAGNGNFSDKFQLESKLPILIFVRLNRYHKISLIILALVVSPDNRPEIYCATSKLIDNFSSCGYWVCQPSSAFAFSRQRLISVVAGLRSFPRL